MKKKIFPKLDDIHTVIFDFDGVFTDNKVMVNEQGDESVSCSRADGLAFDIVKFYQKKEWLKADFIVLSREKNPVVRKRVDKLGIFCEQGIVDKLDFVSNYIASKRPNEADPFRGLIYLGNDLNDAKAMILSGYSVAPLDSHPYILRIADLVIQKKGGDGFVRAFIELLLGVDKLNKECFDELISNC